MSKHTPGPWEAKEDEYGHWGIYASGGECIAITEEREDEANARLIAAAPDMLKLLKGTLRYLRASGNRAQGLQRDISALLEKIGEEDLSEP